MIEEIVKRSKEKKLQSKIKRPDKPPFKLANYVDDVLASHKLRNSKNLRQSLIGIESKYREIKESSKSLNLRLDNLLGNYREVSDTVNMLQMSRVNYDQRLNQIFQYFIINLVNNKAPTFANYPTQDDIPDHIKNLQRGHTDTKKFQIDESLIKMFLDNLVSKGEESKQHLPLRLPSIDDDLKREDSYQIQMSPRDDYSAFSFSDNKSYLNALPSPTFPASYIDFSNNQESSIKRRRRNSSVSSFN